MKDVIDSNKYKCGYIVIVNHYFTVHSHVPHRYIDKLSSDMCSYVIFVLRRFWMSTFLHDASGKYCICKATVGGALYCIRIVMFCIMLVT